MQPLTAVLLLLCAPALAAPGGFAQRPPYASGAAVLEPAAGGEYVHGRPLSDARVRTRAVLAMPPERQVYTFFSAEEEQALLAYRDLQRARLSGQRVVVACAAHGRPHRGLDWPKVIVRAGQTCVPELASSESADWREHLVCHAEGANP
jgi:hypothetical protein